MVKHTQTICQQTAHELFEYVWPFCPFKRKLRKMAKHTQTIRQQIAHELFEYV